MTNTSVPPKASPQTVEQPSTGVPKPDLLAIEIYDSIKKQMSSPMMQGKLFFLSKVSLVLVCYTFLVLNSINDYVSPELVPECMQDKMQDLTLPLNRHLAANPAQKNALIIFASFMIDTNVFIMSARWIIFGKSFKTFLTIFCFYAFRAFMQSVFFMGYPTDYIWGHPGMFSVAVPYQPANDFFFSGHVGLCVICFLDFKRENVPFMKQFAFVSIFVEFFVLLVTRAHYFIDLVTGLIVAHYVYLLGEWIYAHYAKKQEKKIAAEKRAVKEMSKAAKRKEAKAPIKRAKKPSL